MLEKIGQTLDNIDIFKLSNSVAVDQDGIIYKIDKDELCDTIYCIADFENRTSLDDIKTHIINPFKLIVGEHRIDIINNRINGAYFEHYDDQSLDYVVIKFKNNEIKLYDDGKVEKTINNSEFKTHIKAIEKAFHYEVDKYEDFNSLKF